MLTMVTYALLLSLLVIGGDTRSRSRLASDRFNRRNPNVNRDGPRQARTGKPNIVVIMTDDQDSELGSMQYMPKTLKMLREGGAQFTNSFVTTPMCCPSRSSFLTGMYVHNHNTYTNNDNCSSVYWRENHEPYNFATYLNNVGYRTGYFGKYLNEYDGSYIPPGWREWVGMLKNSRFYNYTLNFNGKLIKHGDNYYKDYYTDLIANDSVTFLRQSKQQYPNKPVLMVLSFPAPHGPEDSAPQYQHMFKNVTTHRTPSWNFAPNPDKQWILQFNGKMEPIQQAFTDILQRKRLQTLQSVDDAVEKVYNNLKNIGELDNTYIVFTSDHGYHLGQYGLVKGKAMPYEFDIRVPFYVRGPGVRKGVKIPHIMLNIDIAPTLLEMAGVMPAPHMDGKSMLPLLGMTGDPNNFNNRVLIKKKPWRDAFLLQRGKVTNRMVMKREQMEAEKNNMAHSQVECLKEEHQPPCKPNQEWVCIKNEQNGKLRLQKCRKQQTNQSGKKACVCPEITITKPTRRIRRQVQSNDEGLLERCRIREDNTVLCDQDIFRSSAVLRTQKDAVAKMIREYRKDLKKLKKIQKHLRQSQPSENQGKDFNIYNRDVLWNSDDQCVCDTLADTPTVRPKKKATKKGRRRSRLRNAGCILQGVECLAMNNDHWRTEPKWTLGPFCACTNAANNSYWCLRSLNETHNFLYCEFTTGFISYYDLLRDPYQLRNAVHDVEYGMLRQLHDTLATLMSCKGSRECTIKSKSKDKSGYNSVIDGPVGTEVNILESEEQHLPIGPPRYRPS